LAADEGEPGADLTKPLRPEFTDQICVNCKDTNLFIFWPWRYAWEHWYGSWDKIRPGNKVLDNFFEKE
jgi:hypothetical protein